MEGLAFRPRLAQHAQQSPDALSKITCRFYAQGACREGDNCRFSHVTSRKTANTGEVEALQPYRDTRSQVPCQFYLRGRCLKGAECPYAHTEANAVEQNVPERQVRAEILFRGRVRLLYLADLLQEEKPDNWVREICGALVQFGEGAKTMKISLPSDFSAVRLSMLPHGSSPSSVAGILAHMGFPVPVECVRVPPQGDAAHYSADIRVEDPSFAKDLCATLDTKSLTSGETSQIIAVPVNASMPHGRNSRRVDCKKVHCSWHRPSRMVWLNFGNQSIAQKINNAFNVGAYKVLGQQVNSSGPSRSTGHRNPLAWTVTLTDIPAPATERDVVRDIPPQIQPRHVELGQASYDVNLDATNTMVKSILMQVGPLEWWEPATDSGGKRAKAKARFQDEEDAMKAVTLHNGTPLPFNEKGRLTVQLVYSAKFTVPERIYEVVKAKIEAESQIWKSQHLVFIPYEPCRGNRVLKLEGEASKKVAQAKNALEQILAGETAMREDKALWIPSLGMNGGAYRRLKDIEQSLGVVIIRNKRLSRLHLYGPSEKCREASRLLADLAREDSSTGHAIELDEQKFAWACHGGFKAISAALGGVVAFDIISNPKRILVTGSDKDYKLALSMIANRKREEDLPMRNTTERDCVICWTEADNPIRTRCKHTYCADCFEMFCFSGATGNGEFCIRCAGDLSKRMEILALDELQEHLSPNTFADLLESSFKSHVRRHPQHFRYCPTPDCGQVYRATSSASVFSCSNCFTPVCTTCHVNHQGVTCAEHKDLESGGYEALERTKRQLGIKDCPKCKTAIEKTEGCNHMVCEGCRTHICWKCMRTFKDSGSCYAHMNREHGSIGLDFPEIIR